MVKELSLIAGLRPLLVLSPLLSPLLMSFSLSLTACDAPEDRPPPGLPCTPDVQAGIDPNADVSFDPARPLCVKLQMAAPRFETLRVENRFGVPSDVVIDELFARFTDSCIDAFPSLFNWYETDVEIDGVGLRRVGVRKKGFLGSVMGHGLFKPSLKLKTNRIKETQLLGQTERVTLNNNNQDPTRIRTCLAYALFTAADYPAPRCNLATVMLNGVSLGAYTHVEPVKKRFLKRAFGDSRGDLYEGTLADFTIAHSAGFQAGKLGRWEAKTSDTDRHGARLQGLVDALQVPDSQLLAALEPVLNLNRFMRFWALEMIINHTDGLTSMRNNFFVYFDPTDNHRAVFVPWGTDNVFNDGGGAVNLRPFVFSALPRRLSRIPAARALVKAETKRLLRDVWDADAILAQVERFAAQVRKAQEDPTYDTEISTLRTWVSKRRSRLEATLEAEFPAGSATEAGCMTLPDGGLADAQGGLTLLTALVFAW